MARIPSPLHDKSVPRRVSKPTLTAEAAATAAESAVAPAPRRARGVDAGAKQVLAAKKGVLAKKGAAARGQAGAVPSKKGTVSPGQALPGKKSAAAAGKSASAKKSKAASGAMAKPMVGATAAVVPASAPAKPAKAHKSKLVRDSFTIPKDEYAVLAALKSRALGLGQHARKSELLRAGIQALAVMDDVLFLQAIAAVPTLKTGRPKKG